MTSESTSTASAIPTDAADGPVVELATVRLREDVSEEQLMSASAAFQSAFLDHQDGFVSREMVRRDDGSYLDIIRWQSRAAASAVFEAAGGSAAAQAYFAVMEMPEGDDSGVEFCTRLAAHGRM